MESVSTRLDNETYRLIRETAEEKDVSMAEILREIIEKGMDYNELKRENERLRAEKRTLISDRRDTAELVEYVQEERDLRRHRKDRRDAPAWRRAKWWLLGRNEG